MRRRRGAKKKKKQRRLRSLLAEGRGERERERRRCGASTEMRNEEQRCAAASSRWAGHGERPSPPVARARETGPWGGNAQLGRALTSPVYPHGKNLLHFQRNNVPKQSSRW